MSQFIISSTVTIPAVRCYLISAWDQCEASVEPVAALIHKLVVNCSHVQEWQDIDDYLTLDALQENGWKSSGRITTTTPIVCGDDGFEEWEPFKGYAWRLVACNWPADEDEERLKPFIESVLMTQKRMDEAKAKKKEALAK